MQTFPKPLTPAEESMYFEKMKEGSKEAKKEARDILIEKNLRLVTHVIKKYTLIEKEKDDLISIGTIGLIKAINTFKPEKGNRLASYAAKCIENELLMMLRSEKKKQKDVSIYEPIGTDKEGNEISFFDVIQSEEEDIVEKYAMQIKCIWLKKAIKEELNARESMILYYRYGLNGKKILTQREVAAKLGISRSYVSRMEKRALEKLRNNFFQNEKNIDL